MRHIGSRRRTALLTAVATLTPLAVALLPAGTADAVWGTTGCYPVDTVPPVVSSVTMTPPAVDARNGAKNVHVTALATDSSPRNQPISGIASLTVQLWDPAAVGAHNVVTGVLSRTGGSPEDGTWEGDVRISPWVSGGDGSTWYLAQVVATDRAGNVNNYPGNPDYPNGTAPDDIAKTGWDKTVTVMSTPDVSPPQLTDFTFSPRTVDTTSKAQEVTVKAHASDVGAGVRSISVGFTRSAPFHFTGATLKLVRGTANKGTWKGTAVVREWVGDGTWHASVSMSDRIGNFRDYTYEQLAGWRRNLGVTSRGESKPPRLLDLRYSPHTVDVRTSAQKVDVGKVLVRDNLSGVSAVVVQFDGPGYSVSGIMHRVDGTARRGTWAGRVRVPHCGPPPGTYRTSVFVRDRAGNYRTYGSKRLHRMGLPSTLTVKAKTLDTTAPAMAGDGYGNNSGPILVTFTEDVTGVTTESLQLYDTNTYDPAPMSTFTCVDSAFQTVSCEQGPVRRVSMYPAPNGTPDPYYYVFANQNGVDVQIRDLVGNPMSWDNILGPVSLSAS
jgi:hypothetical protein